MIRRLAVSSVMFAALALGGCEKPDETSCRDAITNMRRLMGTDNLSDNNKLEGEVRRCKGGSTKKAVQCAIAAKTYDELRACGFTKLPATLPTTTTVSDGSAGSAAAGSAATGSAGSAATGSAGSADMGSAGSADAGSAGSGSAATGSAATGSAAGSGAAK